MFDRLSYFYDENKKKNVYENHNFNLVNERLINIPF